MIKKSELHDTILSHVAGMRKQASLPPQSQQQSSTKRVVNRTAGGLALAGLATVIGAVTRGAVSGRAAARYIRGLKKIPYPDLVRRGILPKNAKILSTRAELEALLNRSTGNKLTDFLNRMKTRSIINATLKGENAAYLGIGTDRRPIFAGHVSGMPADIARHEVGHFNAHLNRYKSGHPRYSGFFSDYFGELRNAARADNGFSGLRRRYAYKTPDGRDTLPGLEREAWLNAPNPLEDRNTMRKALSTYLVQRKAKAVAGIGNTVLYPSATVYGLTRESEEG